MISVLMVIPLLALTTAWTLRYRPRSYPFAAALCTAAVLLINFESWLKNPLPYTCALIMALALSGAGVMARLKYGRPMPGWDRPHLVTRGIYRVVRHPFMGSLVVLNFAGLVTRLNVWIFISSAFALVWILLAVRAKEKRDRIHYGPAYVSYCRVTKRLFPYLI